MRTRFAGISFGLIACLVAGSAPLAAAGPGVNATTIKIGIHAPLTGADPIPNQSVTQGAELFWRWLRAKDRPINGRQVRTIVRNDQSNPSTAVAVCKEMVEDHNVFMLVGTLRSSYSYASEACARYAESVSVPYVGLGGSRGVLARLQRYFAITATSLRQARLLADLLVTDHRARRRDVGIVWTDDTASTQTHDAFVATMTKRGAEVTYDRSVSRNATTSEARLIVEEMRLAGVDIVFFLHTPVFFLNVLKQADSQSFRPLWTGVGPGMGGNDQIVDIACGGGQSIDGARFLTFLPAYQDRDRFDRRHDRAMQRVYSSQGDPITWQGWATSQVLKRMLAKPGRRLNRTRFVRLVERSSFRARVLPAVRFRQSDHFGGRGVHLLRAECTDRRWHTARSFVNDF